ncbi:HAD family hydrolase [Nonomuraea indica]|uniref:HAD family hydrolase n=1 Tax=Nonomuraea indica TaxID=1581193 RepID=A0ABW7ZZ80_9ACTN|nr:HAD family hydrolase [Nonomuraea indica]
MATELVILDCDGVLVDSERIAVRVGTAALRRLGRRLDEREFAARFVGCSEEHWLRAVGPDVPPGWHEQLAAEHAAAVEAELTPVAGMPEALARITLPTCVASNGGHAKIARSLRLTGLAERFAGRVFSAEDVARGKPAPDLFLHAAATLGVPPERCVVVEDSPFGVAAARAAGMRCLGFTGGLTPAARLSGATALFDDPRDLPDLLTALP